jgi:hypothetical protein
MPAPQFCCVHRAAWISIGLPPHIWKHWIGLPPPCTQEIVQWSSALHSGSLRQAAAWAQHLVAMQLPQAVPSDAHIAAPQIPPLHWPLQHCAALVHMVPSGLQALMQVPLAQLPEQQSENATHIPPLAVQLGGPQVPWVLHGPEQQG